MVKVRSVCALPRIGIRFRIRGLHVLAVCALLVVTCDLSSGAKEVDADDYEVNENSWSQPSAPGRRKVTSKKVTPLDAKGQRTPSLCESLRLEDSALGMASGAIKDGALSSSSSYNEQSVGPQCARLNHDVAGGAWCPQPQLDMKVSGSEWLQVNLTTEFVVTGIATQGRFGNGMGVEYVEEFWVEYSRDFGQKWHKWKDRDGNYLLEGNEDTYSVKESRLEVPIVGANLIRIVPYSQHLRTVCLRFELYGCPYVEEKDDGAPAADGGQKAEENILDGAASTATSSLAVIFIFLGVVLTCSATLIALTGLVYNFVVRRRRGAKNNFYEVDVDFAIMPNSPDKRLPIVNSGLGHNAMPTPVYCEPDTDLWHPSPPGSHEYAVPDVIHQKSGAGSGSKVIDSQYRLITNPLGDDRVGHQVIGQEMEADDEDDDDQGHPDKMDEQDIVQQQLAALKAVDNFKFKVSSKNSANAAATQAALYYSDNKAYRVAGVPVSTATLSPRPTPPTTQVTFNSSQRRPPPETDRNPRPLRTQGQRPHKPKSPPSHSNSHNHYMY